VSSGNAPWSAGSERERRGEGRGDEPTAVAACADALRRPEPSAFGLAICAGEPGVAAAPNAGEDGLAEASPCGCAGEAEAEDEAGASAAAGAAEAETEADDGAAAPAAAAAGVPVADGICSTKGVGPPGLPLPPSPAARGDSRLRGPLPLWLMPRCAA